MDMTSGDPRRKLRVLALHSFRTSGKIFEEQIQRARLAQSLGDLAELVFIDAPFSASGPLPSDVKGKFDGPYYEWWTMTETGPTDNPYVYHGLEEAERYAATYIEQHGPFDGLAGFSQGAMLAGGLVTMQRAGRLLQGVQPIKFVLLFAGAPIATERHREAQRVAVPVPSVHIYGEKDAMKQWSLALLERFSHPVAMMHPRGHVVPALESYQVQLLRSFLEYFMQDPASSPVPGPQLGPAAEPRQRQQQQGRPRL